ncbi:MAG: large subunit ribosomal protein L21 [Spirochaetes bacterium]|nr:MAG: large subunit ribosomal protein L21 [Spirochaetota bacterium]
MYAVVEISGKQYRAEQGKSLKVDRIEMDPGSDISFETVVLLSGDNGVKVGTPYVAGAVVKAVVDEEVKGDKVIVFKYKPKKDYRRTQGHRQKYTVIKVQEIIGA